MAEAIRTVAALYKDGVLPKPASYAYRFPDLLTFHDAPTAIEQKLFVMFLEHRMRTFQGTFHANPGLRPLVRLERDAARPPGNPDDRRRAAKKSPALKKSGCQNTRNPI